MLGTDPGLRGEICPQTPANRQTLPDSNRMTDSPGDARRDSRYKPTEPAHELAWGRRKLRGRAFRNSFFAGKRMMIAGRMAAKNEFLNTRPH